MKLEIDRTELVNALALANKSIAGKTTRAILANVFMKAANDKLQLVGTDGEQMMIVELPASIDKEGSLTVPAKLMLELCSGLPTNSLFPVSLETNERDYKLTISLDKSRYEVNTMSASDYPPVPNMDAIFVKIDSNGLAEKIKQTSIASALDDGNPVQKSVFLNFVDTANPMIAATDSKRLAITRPTGLNLPDHLQKALIVPIKAVREICAILSMDTFAEIGIFREQLALRSGNTTYITRLVDGLFPAVERVLPKNSPTQIVFYKKEMAHAIKSIMPIAKDNSMLIHFDFAADSVKIWSKSSEKGNAEIVINCKSNGDPINIAFNGVFIQHFLEEANTEECILGLSTPNHPGLLETKEENPFKYIIMPMGY